jgi:hypothetical protein
VKSLCQAFQKKDSNTVIADLPYFQYNSGLRWGMMGDGEGNTSDPSTVRSWLAASNVHCDYYTPGENGHGTLLASAHSVVLIHRRARHLASTSDHGGLQSGDVAQFRIRFDDNNDLVEDEPPVQVGQANTARIEGKIVSVSPFVVSLEGLPLTITVPDGVTLPADLAPGQRIELTVQVGTGNTFTLVAIDEVENENEGQEVEVKGTVTSSTATQIVVEANGTTFTFVPPAGETLPVLATGTFVEARGFEQNGTITLTRLRLEDSGDGDGGGGGDDGGGH